MRNGIRLAWLFATAAALTALIGGAVATGSLVQSKKVTATGKIRSDPDGSVKITTVLKDDGTPKKGVGLKVKATLFCDDSNGNRQPVALLSNVFPNTKFKRVSNVQGLYTFTVRQRVGDALWGLTANTKKGAKVTGGVNLTAPNPDDPDSDCVSGGGFTARN